MTEDHLANLARRHHVVALCRAGAAATRVGESTARAHGLSLNQFLVLDMLAAVGAHSQQELATGIGADRTTMVATVDALERAGLVKRHRNADDRRAYVVDLTPEGRTALSAVASAMEAAESTFFSALNPDERQLLARVLNRVLTATSRVVDRHPRQEST